MAILPMVFKRSQILISVILGCLAVPDRRGNAQDLATLDEQISLPLGASAFILRKRVRPGPSNLVFFAPHDNESVGVAMAEETLEKSGGTLFELKSPRKGGGENRYLTFRSNHVKSEVQIDPNRVFTKKGIIKDLRTHGENKEEVKRSGAKQDAVVNEILDFGKALLAHLKLNEQSMVVTLHNNWNETEICMTRYVKDRRRKPHLFSWKGNLDQDDLFVTTSTLVFKALKLAGYNVVFEGEGEDEGSLSVFCEKQSPPIPYVNIEAEHVYPGYPARGHARQQRRMIEAILTFHLNQKRSAEERQPIPRPIP
jgi:hypothetical protein